MITCKLYKVYVWLFSICYTFTDPSLGNLVTTNQGLLSYYVFLDTCKKLSRLWLKFYFMLLALAGAYMLEMGFSYNTRQQRPDWTGRGWTSMQRMRCWTWWCRDAGACFQPQCAENGFFHPWWVEQRNAENGVSVVWRTANRVASVLNESCVLFKRRVEATTPWLNVEACFDC